MNSDRSCRAADAAKEIAFDREHAGVRQSHGDFVAHQLLELSDAALLDDPGTDRATSRPGEDVPVFQARLRPPFHVRAHALEKRRHELTMDLFRAHTGWKVEEGVYGGALDGRQIV